MLALVPRVRYSFIFCKCVWVCILWFKWWIILFLYFQADGAPRSAGVVAAAMAYVDRIMDLFGVQVMKKKVWYKFCQVCYNT